jgi:hypothetical protein
MKSFRNDWKLYSITIGCQTIIPSYYDIVKFFNKLPIFYIKHLNIVRFSTIKHRYLSLFDTHYNY